MYSNIKRISSLSMVFLMLLALLAGCAKEEQNPVGTVSDYESQAHIQVSVPEDASTPEEASQTPLTGEFVVSEKKYDYKNANLMLLYVENQTNRHFNVTIKGKYLDASGKVIKEETQTFGAFPAGWSNHFIFYPKIAFDSFTYELETDDYTKEVHDIFDSSLIIDTLDNDGNPLTSYIELTYEKKLVWDRALVGGTDDLKEGRMLLLNAEMMNNHPTVTISVEFHVILLDADGNIYLTDFDYSNNDAAVSGTLTTPVGGSDNGRSRFIVPLKEQLRGLDESIPDNVQGVFTAIFAIRDVCDYDKLMEKLLKH